MTDKHTTIRKICVLITLGAIMVLRCSVALAGVEAIQIEKSGIKPSIIVPGVHAPVFGIEAPSAAVFVGKSVLLSEGTEANQDAKTQPEKLEHSVPEIVLSPDCNYISHVILDRKCFEHVIQICTRVYC